jgi:hypothetical protein
MRRRAAYVTFGLISACFAAGCGGGSTTTVTETATVTETTTVASTAGTETGLGAPAERIEFGTIESLTPRGDHYEMRFDPAWLLSGETANVAAAEDGAVAPGEPVPNDYYILDEGHRLLSYIVPDDASVTVLAFGDGSADWAPTPITVSELAQILQGESSIELFEPVDTGVWITVDIDTARAIQQQYRP